MRTTMTLTTLLFLALFALAGSASGDIIADFQFTGSNTSSTDPSTDWATSNVADGTTPSFAINNGQGNPAPSWQKQFSDFYPANSGNKTLADAIGDDIYFSFTVTPDTDREITFDEFSFDISKQGNATFNYALLTSVGGFSDGQQIDGIRMDSGQYSFNSFTYDVSSLADIDSMIEFRLYMSPNNFSGGSNYFRVDNILLTGEVSDVSAVPEPTTLTLAALGLLGLIAFRRRRKR